MRSPRKLRQAEAWSIPEQPCETDPSIHCGHHLCNHAVEHLIAAGMREALKPTQRHDPYACACDATYLCGACQAERLRGLDDA